MACPFIFSEARHVTRLLEKGRAHQAWTVAADTHAMRNS
jgi:hypothetical protein